MDQTQKFRNILGAMQNNGHIPAWLLTAVGFPYISESHFHFLANKCGVYLKAGFPPSGLGVVGFMGPVSSSPSLHIGDV